VIIQDLEYRRKTMQRRTIDEGGTVYGGTGDRGAKQHEAGRKVAELSREIGVSEPAIYTWKPK
jgi:hypothetical protein